MCPVVHVDVSIAFVLPILRSAGPPGTRVCHGRAACPSPPLQRWCHDLEMSNVANAHGVTVRRLATVSEMQLLALAEVLVDCVDGGASVSFMHPLPIPKAIAFWRRVADDVVAGGRALLVAEDASGIVGTVQLVLDLPENQPHRADVSKMLVHRRARRHGIGAALMQGTENIARESGKTLLVLDTASADAERLYARLGWQLCGVIPGFALLPGGGLCATSYFYRTLDR
jgi:GNAT superfamily N-acetyltransferase